MRNVLGLSLALLALSAVPAVAWQVTVKNCGGESVEVRSYDQGDLFRIVANEMITLSATDVGTISCVGQTHCQLRFSYGSLERDLPVATHHAYVRKMIAPNGATIDFPSNC